MEEATRIVYPLSLARLKCVSERSPPLHELLKRLRLSLARLKGVSERRLGELVVGWIGFRLPFLFLRTPTGKPSSTVQSLLVTPEQYYLHVAAFPENPRGFAARKRRARAKLGWFELKLPFCFFGPHRQTKPSTVQSLPVTPAATIAGLP